MASNKNSSSNRVEVPEARDAMDRFKMEVANELGVNLKQGYNGDITARDAGSIGPLLKSEYRKNELSALENEDRRLILMFFRWFSASFLSVFRQIVIDSEYFSCYNV